MKILDGLKYDRSLAKDEAYKEGILPPGTEYNFKLSGSSLKDIIYISYGAKDQALGIDDKVYILHTDISAV